MDLDAQQLHHPWLPLVLLPSHQIACLLVPIVLKVLTVW